MLTSQSALKCCSCLAVLLHPHASAPQHTTSHLPAPSSGRHEGESRHDAGAERRQQAEARFQAMEAAGAPLGTKCALCHGTEVGEDGGRGAGWRWNPAVGCTGVLLSLQRVAANLPALPTQRTTLMSAHVVRLWLLMLLCGSPPSISAAADEIDESSRGLGGRSPSGLGQMILVRVSGLCCAALCYNSCAVLCCAALDCAVAVIPCASQHLAHWLASGAPDAGPLLLHLEHAATHAHLLVYHQLPSSSSKRLCCIPHRQTLTEGLTPQSQP